MGKGHAPFSVKEEEEGKKKREREKRGGEFLRLSFKSTKI